jgi:hypothetical protein
VTGVQTCALPISAAAEREKGKRDSLFNRPKTPVRDVPPPPPEEDLTYIRHVNRPPRYLSEIANLTSEKRKNVPQDWSSQ